MTIDEAIKHAEEVAEENKKKASWFWVKKGNPNYENCVECAEEHLQLAEWLKELKELKQSKEQQPCDDCISRQAVMDCFEKWEPYLKGNSWSHSFREELSNLQPVNPTEKMGQCKLCTDVISRQAVLDAFWKLNVELRPSAIDAITNMIKDLSPVNPTEK